MQKVLIFGSFDILHPGHIFVIKEAMNYGEVHAGFALDETIIKLKGRLPYNSLEVRMKNIEAYGVTPHAGDPVDRLRVVREVDPAIVVLGHDQHFFVDALEEYQRTSKPDLKIIRIGSFHDQLFSSSKFRKVLEDEKAGFLLIDKRSGEPSLRTVTKLRNSTGIKQIGFSGTLDPLASGLLICGISRATTLLDWFHFFPKTYEAELKLGEASDTYDSEGKVDLVSDRIPSEKEITGALAMFLGNTSQEPPMFSAKKVQGKKLYELARKGHTVERKRQTISIDSIEMMDYQYPKLGFRVTCSTGTYVRSLIHDIGQKLGVGAHMTALRRLAIGPYNVEHAIDLTANIGSEFSSNRVSPEDVRMKLNEHIWRRNA